MLRLYLTNQFITFVLLTDSFITLFICKTIETILLKPQSSMYRKQLSGPSNNQDFQEMDPWGSNFSTIHRSGFNIISSAMLKNFKDIVKQYELN